MTILITGANGNIGSYLAQKFLDDGHALILFHRWKSDRIEQLIEHDSVEAHSVELGNWQQVQSAIDSLRSKPQALIHTASVRSTDFMNLASTDPEHWKATLDSNVLGCYHILKATIPILRHAKPGRIVLFGSDVSRIGLMNGSAYAASKAAIGNICRTVALEEKDVLCNVLSPGPVEIDDTHFPEMYRLFREEYYRKQLARIPQGRLAKPNDIYGLCRFLVSNENSYLTGEEFYLTGGKI